MVERVYRSVKGMPDGFGSEVAWANYVEENMVSIAQQWGYQLMRLPLLEPLSLVVKAVGTSSDIATKELYAFEDKGGKSIVLRPEGTAGCVRACIQHGLLHHTIQRVVYSGPMFRRERPQRGRFRQFHQVGLEAFGISDSTLDLELITITWHFFQRLGLTDKITLHLNSIGEAQAREAYKQALRHYAKSVPYFDDPLSQQRLAQNPLRILDDLPPQTPWLQEVPTLQGFLDPASRDHFESICLQLQNYGIPFIKDPYLVRGLDYYNRTVFEWITKDLGAQSTLCGGGRYDGLTHYLGGPQTPAAGFALGVERVVDLMRSTVSRPLTKKHPQGAVLLLEGSIKLGAAWAAHIRQTSGHCVAYYPKGRASQGFFRQLLEEGKTWVVLLRTDTEQVVQIDFKQIPNGPRHTVSDTEQILHKLKQMQ